jgi:hypothetical protein
MMAETQPEDVQVQTVQKTTQKRKRNLVPEENKKRQKSKNTIYDKLSVSRKREINQIVRRVTQNDMITPIWLSNSVRTSKQHQRKVEMMDDYKNRLTTQFATATVNITDDAKKDRMTIQYNKKIKRCDTITKNFKVGIDAALRPTDVVFLSKIHVYKPLSGYMMYAKGNRDRVQSNNKEAGFGQIGRIIGTEWKNLTIEQRDEWKQKALEQHKATGVVIPEAKIKKENTRKRVKKNATIEEVVQENTQVQNQQEEPMV